MKHRVYICIQNCKNKPIIFQLSQNHPINSILRFERICLMTHISLPENFVLQKETQTIHKTTTNFQFMGILWFIPTHGKQERQQQKNV